MKTAVLIALLGLTSGQEMMDEEDFQEDIKELFPWPAMKEYGRQAGEIDNTLHSKEARDEHNNNMRKLSQIGGFWAKAGPKYLPELKAFDRSEDVRKVRAAERRIMHSREMKDFVDDVEDLGEDIVEADMGEKPTRAGYLKWVDNEDLADMAEDVQDIMRSFKRLARSR